MYYRFDLIFLVLDPQDEVFDRRLASHLVSLYYKDFTNSQDDEDIVVSFKNLRRLRISFIRNRVLKFLISFEKREGTF